MEAGCSLFGLPLKHCAYPQETKRQNGNECKCPPVELILQRSLQRVQNEHKNGGFANEISDKLRRLSSFSHGCILLHIFPTISLVRNFLQPELATDFGQTLSDKRREN
jgi:hypothetical protein